MMLLLERLLTGAMVVPFALGAASVPAQEREVAFSFSDERIVESSGLVVQRDGLFATVNDSGDEGRVFAVAADGDGGDTVGVTTWGEAEDVEALAPWDRDEVLVGDIGDNAGRRESVSVLRVPLQRSDRTIDPEPFELAYDGGPRDAEALLVHPVTRRVYVASKEIFGGTLFAAPEQLSGDGVNRLEPVGPVLSIATDGAFFPDGKHLMIRDYARAVVYAFPSLERVAEVELPEQDQGEGLAIDRDGEVFVSTEGQFTAVLHVRLPRALRSVVTPAAATAPAAGESEGPSPGTQSREGVELPETTSTDRSSWPWLLAGLLGLGAIVALLFSLRRR